MLSTHGPGLYPVPLLMPEARSIVYRYMLQKQLCLKAQPLFFLIVLLYPHSHLIVCEMGKTLQDIQSLEQSLTCQIRLNSSYMLLSYSFTSSSHFCLDLLLEKNDKDFHGELLA